MVFKVKSSVRITLSAILTEFVYLGASINLICVKKHYSWLSSYESPMRRNFFLLKWARNEENNTRST